MAILKDYPDTTTPLTVENLLDFCHPVGSYYDTSDTLFDPNVAWGGTWELDEDGTVLASKSSTSGSILNANVGSIVGEETHTLTISEMPSHNHTPNTNCATMAGSGTHDMAQTSGGRTYEFLNINSTGGGQAHNNVQRTKIINRWHRTA